MLRAAFVIGGNSYKQISLHSDYEFLLPDNRKSIDFIIGACCMISLRLRWREVLWNVSGLACMHTPSSITFSQIVFTSRLPVSRQLRHKSMAIKISFLLFSGRFLRSPLPLEVYNATLNMEQNAEASGSINATLVCYSSINQKVIKRI